MELRPATAEAYLRHAFDQMLEVADQLGEPQINHPSDRDRGSEFTRVVATFIELQTFVAGAIERSVGHLGHTLARDSNPATVDSNPVASSTPVPDTGARRL